MAPSGNAENNQPFRSGERLTLHSDLVHGAKLRVIVVDVDEPSELTREHMLRASWTVHPS